jgi:hypothetical protein
MPEGTGDLRAGRAGGAGTGDDHEIAAGQRVALAAEVIAEDALDAVADHGALVDLAGDGEAQAGRVVGREVVQGEQGVRSGAAAAGEHGVEFRTRAYPRGARVSGGDA